MKRIRGGGVKELSDRGWPEGISGLKILKRVSMPFPSERCRDKRIKNPNYPPAEREEGFVTGDGGLDIMSRHRLMAQKQKSSDANSPNLREGITQPTNGVTPFEDQLIGVDRRHQTRGSGRSKERGLGSLNYEKHRS